MARKIEVIPARPEFTNRAERKQRKTRLAVYCRVSTSQEDQLESFENQQIHYRDYVASHPTYELVKIYADMKTPSLIQFNDLRRLAGRGVS